MSLPTTGDVHVPSATEQPKRRRRPLTELAKEARKLEPYPGEVGLARSPFTYDPDFLKRLRPDQVPRFYGVMTDGRELPLVEVELGDLIATQDRVDPVKVENKRTAGRTGVVVSIGNGELYIVDGHHDLSAAWLNGVDRMGVHFKDLGERSMALKGVLGRLLKGFSPSQPRDADGRWVRVGGGGKVPDLDTSGWGPDGRAAANRASSLRAAATRGDLESVQRLSRPTITPNRPSRYSLQVNDFGDRLAAALERATGRGGNTPPPMPSEIPRRPDLSNWGPQADSTRRRINAIHDAASNPDRAAALAAVQAMQTSRSNTYARAADDYRTSVLRALGHAGDAPPTPVNLDARRELGNTMQRTRQRERQRLDGMDPNFAPRNRAGHNVTEMRSNLTDVSSQRFFSKSKAETLLVAQNMIADYPNAKFKISIFETGPDVQFRYQGDDGTSITRRFTKNSAGELQVYHAYFQAGNQGNGAGKEFFRTSFGQYQKLGIKEVTVSANIDVGTYAWSKYGFKPTSETAWQGVRDNVAMKLNDMKAANQIDTDTYNRMARLVASPNVDNLAKIADSTLGKKLLIGAGVWKGKLRLDNPAQMRRFTDYVTRENRGQAAA
jgi:hypothetical protein